MRPAPTLRIAIHRYGGRPRIARSWTLGCEPLSGTAPHPAASCAALRDFLTHPHRQKHVCLCPVILPGSLYATIDGTLDGKPLRARLGICLTCGLSGRAVRDLQAATGLHSFAHL